MALAGCAYAFAKQLDECIHPGLDLHFGSLVDAGPRIQKRNAVGLQESVHESIEKKDRHIHIEIGTQLATSDTRFDHRFQIFSRKEMDLLEEFCPEREFFLEDHFEVNLVYARMPADEADARMEALAYALEEVRLRGFLLDFSQRMPDEIDCVFEYDLEEAFFRAEVLEDGSLGYAELLDHAVDARLAEALMGELIDRCIEDSLLLVVFELLKGFPWNHDPSGPHIMTRWSL